MHDDDGDENPRPLAVEGRPIYKMIDKYERAGDKNCLEPAWKGHCEELRVDMITALTLALLFDALLGETTEVAGAAFGPIILEAFHLRNRQLDPTGAREDPGPRAGKEPAREPARTPEAAGGESKCFDSSDVLI
jgi:hypothetical protein